VKAAREVLSQVNKDETRRKERAGKEQQNETEEKNKKQLARLSLLFQKHGTQEKSVEK
jgi:hypothetical protein